MNTKHTTTKAGGRSWPLMSLGLITLAATALAMFPPATLNAIAAAQETATGPQTETLPEGLQIERLEAYPPTIELEHRFDYRQLLILGRLASGEIVDLTRMVQPDAAPQFVEWLDGGRVRGQADGHETLRFSHASLAVEVPVQVHNVETRPEVSFVRDVQPLLSRMGCNSGTCHGSKDGKEGFKLSLRGYDALYDHRALTDDIAARRINRAAPDQSLILLKATGSIPHTGGALTRQGEAYYEIVRQWIANGSQLDLDSPRVTRIDVYPRNPILPRAGLTLQMTVQATFSDGSVRDVSREAFVESGDIEIIKSHPDGRLTMLRRGEAPVLVRYEGAYASTILTVMGDRNEFVWNDPEPFNYIDKHVYNKLQRVKVSASDICSDEEFIRRVTLDLTGLLPTADDVRNFVADARPTRVKRDELVDILVGSHEFVEHWTNKWADLLQVNRKYLGEEGAMALRDWIRNAVASNMPYDQFAHQIMTASGSTIENPPAGYFKTLRDADALMENTTHLFLAIRFNCNKCHDHPFERWTQDQYYHLAAYFAQVGMKEDPAFQGQKLGGTAVEGAKPLVEVVFDRDSGEVTHERTGEVAAPVFPFEHAETMDAADAGSRREQLAQWLTSQANPYFARSYVNRLWGYLYGVGIIEPIDDIRAGNPPTNPELLDALTNDFVAHGFDVQHMFRTICKSRTYQHSIATDRWNEDDLVNFSHAIPRRLPAEVLYDAIHMATGSTPKLPGVPIGFRAAELPDAGVSLPFLDDFGRPARESSCECERSTGVVLGPVMKLVNGPTVADAIADPKNILTELVKTQSNDEKVVEEIFLRFLGRRPTLDEIGLALETIQSVGQDHDQIVQQLEQYEARLPELQAQWEAGLLPNPQWTTLTVEQATSAVGGQFQTLDDGSLQVTGELAKDVYTIEGTASGLERITAIRLEALGDPSLPAGGPGRAPNGNFVLSELQLSAVHGDEAREITLQKPYADFSQDGWDVASAIDGNPDSGWAVSPQFNKSHFATFETAEDLVVNEGLKLRFSFSQQYPDGKHLLGRLRISVTDAERPIQRPALAKNVSDVLAVAADQRSEAQRAELAQYYQANDRQLQLHREAVKRSQEQLANRRLIGVQDLAWALINTPSFLFNR